MTGQELLDYLIDHPECLGNDILLSSGEECEFYPIMDCYLQDVDDVACKDDLIIMF